MIVYFDTLQLVAQFHSTNFIPFYSLQQNYENAYRHNVIYAQKTTCCYDD